MRNRNLSSDVIKGYKAIFLVLLLVVPAGIYLFLRTFGTNRFDVPVYHRSGIEGCGAPDTVHTLPGRFAKGNMKGPRASVRTVSFMTDTVPGPQLSSYMLNLTRAFDALAGYHPLQFITVIDPAADSSSAVQLWNEHRDRLIPEPQRWHYMRPENQIEYRELLKCGLGFDAVGLQPHYSVVLLDTEGRIRGYYDGCNDEDTERLILEGKILFDNINSSVNGDD